MTDLSKLSVVVLSYNRFDCVVNNVFFLNELRKKYHFQLIVVDNASEDGSADWLKKFKEMDGEFLLVNNEANLGVAGGRNSAIPYIRDGAEYILRVDDDTEIDERSIVALFEYISGNDTFGAVTPLVVHAKTKASQNYSGESICSVSNYHGACHIIRKSLIDDIGEIDPECSFGGEELDYSIKIRDLGYDVVYNPDIVVGHNNFIRKGPEGVSRKRMRVYNMARMSYKYWPLGMAFLYSSRLFLSHLISALRYYPLGVFFGHFFDYFRGLKAGLKSRVKLSSLTVDFYRSGDLSPDIGNVSLGSKVRRKINSKFVN